MIKLRKAEIKNGCSSCVSNFSSHIYLDINGTTYVFCKKCLFRNLNRHFQRLSALHENAVCGFCNVSCNKYVNAFLGRYTCKRCSVEIAEDIVTYLENCDD